MASIKKNFAWSLLLTCSGYILPLITYPYISRILGVDNMGLCGYIDSIINYFVLFSALGVGSLGVREVARTKNDPDRLSEVFSSLLGFNVMMTMFSVSLLSFLTFCLPSFYEYRQFYFIGIFKLISQAFLIEWFFKGLQDFKYVTLVALFIKVLYVIGIFVLVHSKEDVVYYYLLNTLICIVSSIINIIYSRKYVRFSLSKIKIKTYLTAILSFGYYLVLTSMYTSFNTFFLGFTWDNTQVGYYVTATKLNEIIMSVFSAFTAVMIPKVAELLKDGDTKELQRLAGLTFRMLFSLAIPIIVYCQFESQDIILLLSGPGYEGASTPFRIIVFLILIIGMEQITIQQFLMASKKISLVAILSTIGAVVGLLINFTVTTRIGAVGSAVSWGVSELIVLICAIYFLHRHLDVVIKISDLYKEVVYSLLYIVPLFVINLIVPAPVLRLMISAFFSGIMFLLINLVLNKNLVIIELINKFIHINRHENV